MATAADEHTKEVIAAFRATCVAPGSSGGSNPQEVLRSISHLSGSGISTKFVDVHIHLADEKYCDSVGQIIDDAKQSNVIALVANSMNLQTSLKSLQLAERYSGLVFAALGIHPWHAKRMDPGELEQTRDLVFQCKTEREDVVAIGEIGLDPQYGRDRESRELQEGVFIEMLRAAEKLSLPIIVHSRWSAQRIMDALSSHDLKKVLWHWFSGPISLLPQILDGGHFVSEGPPVAFSKRIRDVVKHVPLTSLLTETDGPVQFYGPFKGRMTTPAFVPSVVKAIAKIKGMEEIDVAQQIVRNFTNFFSLQEPRRSQSSCTFSHED